MPESHHYQYFAGPDDSTDIKWLDVPTLPFKIVTIIGGPLHGQVITVPATGHTVEVDPGAPSLSDSGASGKLITIPITVHPDPDMSYVAFWPDATAPKPPFLCPVCGRRPDIVATLDYAFGWRCNCPVHGHFPVSMQMVEKYGAKYGDAAAYLESMKHSFAEWAELAKSTAMIKAAAELTTAETTEITEITERPSHFITIETIRDFAQAHGLLDDPADVDTIPVRSIREQTEDALGHRSTAEVIDDISEALAEYDEESAAAHAVQAEKMLKLKVKVTGDADESS